MDRTLSIHRTQVTLGDLRVLLSEVPAEVPDDTPVRVEQSARSNSPLDPGGDVHISVTWR